MSNGAEKIAVALERLKSLEAAMKEELEKAAKVGQQLARDRANLEASLRKADGYAKAGDMRSLEVLLHDFQTKLDLIKSDVRALGAPQTTILAHQSANRLREAGIPGDIQRLPVVSSNLKSMGYDTASGTLEVEFSSGQVYRYRGVPPELWRRLVEEAAAAERAVVGASVGRLFISEVRSKWGPDRFTRMTERAPKAAPVQTPIGPADVLRQQATEASERSELARRRGDTFSARAEQAKALRLHQEADLLLRGVPAGQAPGVRAQIERAERVGWSEETVKETGDIVYHHSGPNYSTLMVTAGLKPGAWTWMVIEKDYSVSARGLSPTKAVAQTEAESAAGIKVVK
ncbi:MAG: hypothetical protein A2Y38_01730 [Spirochaetes bacterium GWB1_59_5]|nr:MAG: hypothetical protein A2Y38_01730 [Spirochaetes bacterium GWB1_59_5]